MNPRLDHFLAELRAKLRAEPTALADAETAEIRQHLEDSIRRLQAEEPALTQDTATLKALAQFGDIDDYLQGRASRGSKLERYRWSRLNSRQRALAWVALALVVCLVAASATLLILDQQERRGSALLRQSLVLTNFTGPVNETFVVPAGTPGLHVSLRALDRMDAATGCGNLTLGDPSGRVLLSQATGCDRLDTQLAAPPPGSWTLSLTLTNFTGTFEMNIMTKTKEAAH